MIVLSLCHRMQQMSLTPTNIHKGGNYVSTMSEVLPSSRKPSPVVDYAGNDAIPFDESHLSQTGASAHSTEQTYSLKDLRVYTPDPYLYQAECNENVHNNVDPNTVENLGIQTRPCHGIANASQAERLTTKNNQYGKTEKGKPVSMENIPSLASWLGHIPEGFCKADGQLMKLLVKFNLTKNYSKGFVEAIGEILKSVRVKRNVKAHDDPKLCEISEQKWDLLVKELQDYQYVTSKQRRKLTKFYHLLGKGKTQLMTN